MNEIVVGIIVFLITAPISAYLGYKANIIQNKRKEFNQLAEPILFDLIRHNKNYLINKDYKPLKYNDFDHQNIEKIYVRVNSSNKRKLKKLLHNYLIAHNNIINKNISEIDQNDYDEALNKLEKLERFFKLK